MKHDRKKRRSKLIAVILKYLLLCISVIILGNALAIQLEGMIEDNFWRRTDISYLMSQKEYLKDGQYSKLYPGGGYNYSGYFEIVDSNARVIYSSDPGKKNKYSPQVLSFIPDSDIGESFYMDELSNGGPAKFMVTQDKATNKGQRYSGLLLIDDHRNVIYDSIGVHAKSISEETFELLKKNADGRFLQKESFKTGNGKTRYLLYHVGNRNKLYRELENEINAGDDIFNLSFATLCIIFFALRMVRILKRPLNELSEAMTDFASTGRPKKPDYDGISEFVDIMDAFEKMEEQLEKSDRERRDLERQKQQMITDISHDLKTPATVIQGYADALAGGAVPEEDREKYIKIIQHRSVQLTELINTFFEYSKLNHPDMKPVMERGDFCEFFREYLAEKYEELDAGGCTLDLDIPEEEMMLSFDSALMKRVFENIFSNSIRHNGGAVALYAGISQDDGSIVVRIGDGGKGISEELRQDIFSPFVVGNKARTSGQGTGLGLAIARKIVELHGGTITLLPAGSGGWSVLFEIRLPRKQS